MDRRLHLTEYIIWRLESLLYTVRGGHVSLLICNSCILEPSDLIINLFFFSFLPFASHICFVMCTTHFEGTYLNEVLSRIFLFSILFLSYVQYLCIDFVRSEQARWPHRLCTFSCCVIIYLLGLKPLFFLSDLMCDCSRRL